MEEIRNLNILVLGNSGAGKSTLIRAVSKAEVQTGIGAAVTQNIAVYTSGTWPFNFIDTKGYEYNRAEQRKTLRQVNKYTKEQLKANKGSIDVVWYCIDAMGKRIPAYNIDMMVKTVKKWKNIPVFVVITKSFSEAELDENINAIEQAFSKAKHINLKAILPVVAEQWRINEELVIQPRGVTELCTATLDCSEEARLISSENRERMILEQKGHTADAMVVGATAAAVVVGAVPIAFDDSFILVPLETALTKGIFKVYDIEFSGELVSAVIGSTVITNIARATVSTLVKLIPNVAGSVISAVVAGFFVSALGEAIIALSEAIYLGKLDAKKTENAVAFMTEKFKSNPMFKAAITYIEKNADKLQGKTAKEIFTLVSGAIKPSDGKK